MNRLLGLLVLTFMIAVGAGCASSDSAAIQPQLSAAQPTAGVAPVTSIYGMVKAFDEAKGYVPTKSWIGQNAEQRTFLRDYMKLTGETGKISPSMLKAIAADDAKVINKFLADNGLSMRLSPFGRGGFGAAAVLSIEGKWSAQATELVGDDGKKYPAVSLKLKDFYHIPGHNLGPVARIYQSKEFNVYVTPWDGDDEGFNAIKAAADLTPDATSQVHPKRYSQLVMPMIDLDRTVKLDWLVGMTGGGYTLREAVAQTKLKLDEHGFSVKDGFAFGTERSIPTTYTLNRPFLFWVEVKGLSNPVFAIKVDPKHWKRPK